VSDLIQIRAFQFAYRNQRVILRLDDVSVKEGQRVAVLGASGCGKSTLLRLLAGLLDHEVVRKGTLTIRDVDPKRYRLHFGHVSMLFQEPVLLPNRDVKWNVSLPLRIDDHANGRARPVADMNKRVTDALREVGLEGNADDTPATLSGGMRARVALARAFVTKPALVLLDEPFGSLDVGWRADLNEKLVQQVRRHDCTCVLVTHDPHEAMRIAERVILLSYDGTVALDSVVGRTSAQDLESRLKSERQRLLVEKVVADA
jgi:NitT/TauT family transport system ATP-binding protein